MIHFTSNVSWKNVNTNVYTESWIHCTLVFFPSQGHHVAGFYWCIVSRRERQPAAGRPAGDWIVGVPVAAFTSTSAWSETCGCGSVAPWTQTATHFCPAWQLPLLHGRLPPTPPLRAAGCGRLSSGPQLCTSRAQGKDFYNSEFRMQTVSYQSL